MNGLDMTKLSSKYQVRRLTKEDIPIIYELCLKNQPFYEYCGKQPTMERIESDLRIAPPGIDISDKYYIGFFEEDTLMAVMDLIDGYPDEKSAFIGFFMMNMDFQGKGIGSLIVSEVFDYLKNKGFTVVGLGIDKDNPQSNHFWKKNGFSIVKEYPQEEGVILLAEKNL
ncbi:MAG: GNAT family N-acetyltransferase [Eubacterium sp.]|nr:GNAT family N-acetyltransferase [Eubacterium sp.]